MCRVRLSHGLTGCPTFTGNEITGVDNKNSVKLDRGRRLFSARPESRYHALTFYGPLLFLISLLAIKTLVILSLLSSVSALHS